MTSVPTRSCDCCVVVLKRRCDSTMADPAYALGLGLANSITLMTKMPSRPLSSFLRSLFTLVSDESNTGIAGWGPDGSTFIIVRTLRSLDVSCVPPVSVAMSRGTQQQPGGSRGDTWHPMDEMLTGRCWAQRCTQKKCSTWMVLLPSPLPVVPACRHRRCNRAFETATSITPRCRLLRAARRGAI